MDPRQTAETFVTLQPLAFWLVAGLTGVCAIATVVTQNIVRAATWLLFTLAGTSAVFFLLGADLVGATQLLVYVGGTLVLVIFGVMLTAQGPFISMKTSGAEWAISVVAGLLLLAVLTTGIITERSVGAPKVWGTVTDPDTGQRRAALITSDVTRYAPPYSRAERLQRDGKPRISPPLMGGPKGMAAPQGTGGPKGMSGPKGGAGPPPGIGPPGAGGEKKKKKGAKDDAPGAPKKGAAPPPPVIDPSVIVPSPPSEPALDPATSPQSAALGEGFLGAGIGPAHRGVTSRVARTSYLLPFEIVSVHLLVVLIGAAYLARAKRRRGVPS